MSHMHALHADNRRPAGNTPAITPFARISTAVAKVTALALCGLVCLALGSPVIRADTLSGVDGPSALRGLSPLPTGVRQAGAVMVEETSVDDNVAQARPEPMQKSPQPKQASPLLQPREMSTPRPERVAFQNPFPGEPVSFSAEPGPLGKQSGMSSEACEMDLPPIGDVTTDIRPPEGNLPFDCARTKLPQLGQVSPGEPACREWPQILYPWEATSYCHRPLYFEEVNLERYGYMCCDHRCGGVTAALVQPVLSGAHFFATVPLLPYKMTVDPACECIYTLGHYRPGSPVPYQIHRMPLRPVAGGVEAVAITGLIFAIP
ncbi:MAG TPA: hypothetical protein VMY37_37690 [Thermoguttaceae bacterium]|nr:hypothetical protein [Thermoguttaceae bacterium]